MGSGAEAGGGVGGRWAFDGERDDVEAAEDDEAKGALLFGDGGSLRGGGFGGLALDTTEFFGVGEDNVHVLMVS